MSRNPRLWTSTAPPPVQARGMVHELVAETAKELARAIYEEGAHSNEFYAKWPSEEEFVRLRWSMFVQPARENLASLLHPSRKSMTSDEMKRQIHEALLLNAAVNPAINQVGT
jgi:hypothetical protein